jgi:hypothetical protein
VVTRKGGVLSPPAEQFIELLRAQAAAQAVENLPVNIALASTQKQPMQ